LKDEGMAAKASKDRETGSKENLDEWSRNRQQWSE
jgi:hypothetical protein